MPDPAQILREAYDQVRRDYGAAIGQRREELVTPALVLDIDAAQRNIDHMASELKQMGAAMIRPHYKAHKSPDIARRQVAGGRGRAVHGHRVGGRGARRGRVRRPVRGQHRGPPGQAPGAGRAGPRPPGPGRGGRGGQRRRALGGGRRGRVHARDHGRGGHRDGPLRGGLRGGLPGAGPAGDRPARAAPGGHHRLRGALLADRDNDLRHERQRAAMAFFTGVAELLEADGIACPIRSAGGIATWNWTAAYPGITEIQAGTYVVMDNFHGVMVPGFEHSLTHRGHGDQPAERQGHRGRGQQVGGRPGRRDDRRARPPVFRFDEEHGIFAAPAARALRVGDPVALVPGYSPSTVNWYDAYHVVPTAWSPTSGRSSRAGPARTAWAEPRWRWTLAKIPRPGRYSCRADGQSVSECSAGA